MLKVDCLDKVNLAGLGGVFMMPLAGLAMVFWGYTKRGKVR